MSVFHAAELEEQRYITMGYQELAMPPVRPETCRRRCGTLIMSGLTLLTIAWVCLRTTFGAHSFEIDFAKVQKAIATLRDNLLASTAP